MLIAAASTLFALMVNVLGLKSDDLHRKFVFYKIATYLSLLSGLFFLLILSLLLFSSIKKVIFN